MSEILMKVTDAGIGLLTKSIESGVSASITVSAGLSVAIDVDTWRASQYGTQDGIYKFTYFTSENSWANDTAVVFTEAHVGSFTVTKDYTAWKASSLGGASGTYTFTYDGTNYTWKYNGIAVSLYDYGLDTDGQLADGNTITITCTIQPCSLSTYGITVTGTPANKNLITVTYAVGCLINFTRFGFGNGACPDEPEAQTELVNEIISTAIRSFTRGTNYISLEASFDNSVVAETFTLTEIGVFALDPDIESEVLFAYINQENEAEPVLSSYSNKVLENEFSVQIIMDSDANVTAMVDSIEYVSRASFNAHLNDHDNPHGVTKAQLGLGNVDNVKAENATVSFTASGSLVVLNTGETIRVLFGKLATAVTSLISHIANHSNPHQVSLAQVGAAAQSHTHTASDIQTGTLSVQRGGTGVDSWTLNRLMYAKGEKEIGQLTHPSELSYLMQNSTGAPFFAAKSEDAIYYVGTTAPDDTRLLWIDTTASTGGLKYFDASNNVWLHVPVAYTTN